jgi:hypothetical protein
LKTTLKQFKQLLTINARSGLTTIVTVVEVSSPSDVFDAPNDIKCNTHSPNLLTLREAGSINFSRRKSMLAERHRGLQ